MDSLSVGTKEEETMSLRWRWSVGVLCCAILLGCNKEAGTPVAGTGTESTSATETTGNGNVLPVAAIGADTAAPKSLKPLDGLELEEDPEAEDMDVELVGEPLEGSPDWHLREVAKLRFESGPATEDVTALREFRKTRNNQIIDHTAEVIKATHQDPKQNRLFEVAVHYMLEARSELALQGDHESISALYEDAASLWERDKNSKAAADAAFSLVNLSYQQAQKSTYENHKWLDEFARQTLNFALNFPKEERRGAPMLYTAARSCELFTLHDMAVKCYSQLQVSYPQHSQVAKVKGILRRLQLPGKQVKLGGPTLAGGFLNHEDLQGQVVLLVYWSMQAKPFLDDLPALQEFEKAYRASGLKIIGVCLDEDPALVEKFLAQKKITWPQIFYSETGKRGWNNPIATHYGIEDVGYWLIDSQGIVVSTAVKTADLEQQLSPLLKRGISRSPNPPR